MLSRLRERGVLRVAASYAVIAWLLLQIADVTFEPLGVPRWVMITLITAAVLGFPVAIMLAWHFELGDRGLARDTAADAAARPVVHGLRRYADVAIIGVLLATVAALLVRQSDLAKPPPPDRPTIAVLPFANLSGDPEQEYFSDGLAQELLDRLGRVPGLAVIGRSSSFSFKGKALDARTIAGRLGATTILEGAVRRTGQQLRVSATLVDGDTGRTIWSQSYDRAMTDVFAVQEEVAAAVIEAIVPAARGNATNAVTPPPTRDTAAYDLYLLGRAAQEARTPDRMRESVAYFERAVQPRSGLRQGLRGPLALADALAELRRRRARRRRTRRNAPKRPPTGRWRSTPSSRTGTPRLARRCGNVIRRAPRSCTSGRSS